MKFETTRIAGVEIIDIEPRGDSRGFFARTFCEVEFGERGLPTAYPQMNISFNQARGTLRGMHFQRAPHAEPKVVRCVRGAIYDVALDLRPESPTFRQWLGIELDDQNRRALYIPAGFAHGFQTLTEEAEVLYLMGERYHPESAAGVRWNDPQFAIEWPLPNPIVSARDAEFPDFVPPRLQRDPGPR